MGHPALDTSLVSQTTLPGNINTDHNGDISGHDDTGDEEDSDQPLPVNHKRSYPESKFLPAIFPHHTYVSIVKTDRAAFVRIISPAPTLLSSLELGIYSANLSYIARELFGVFIQVEHGRYYYQT